MHVQKYASKSYRSCALHILSFCLLNVSGFIEMSLTVLVIEQTQNCLKKKKQREIKFSKNTQARVIILVHDILSHCAL